MTRSSRMLPVLSATALVTLGVALAGCTTDHDGTPTATTTTDSGSTSAPSSGSQTASDDWWKTANACNLLDQTTASGLGYPQPGQIQDGHPSNCAWTASDGSTFVISLQGQPYDSLSPTLGQLSDVTIAGRPAKQATPDKTGVRSCSLAIEATKGSDAFIDVDTISATTEQACALATTVGTAIAPKLPSGSN